jgi:hypothetical protein
LIGFWKQELGLGCVNEGRARFEIESVFQKWLPNLGRNPSGVKTPSFPALFGTTEVVP